MKSRGVTRLERSTAAQAVKGEACRLSLKMGLRTFDQGRGAGRHTSPLLTTTRRIKTNLKTKTPRTARKIELYGNPTINDLKKSHSSRQVVGMETGSRGAGDHCGTET